MRETDLLCQFNLTSNEAAIYYALLKGGSLNGYQIAIATGISRSNTYNSLASLVEKGCAYKVKGDSTLYSPLSVEEFCTNRLRSLENAKKELVSLIPETAADESEYITIKGAEHIRDKISNMITDTKKRIYLSIPFKVLDFVRTDILSLAAKGIKAVLITDEDTDLKGVTLYVTDEPVKQVRIISDSSKVLTGDFDGPTCLYSEKANLVELIKDSVKNEMTLIEIRKQVTFSD